MTDDLSDEGESRCGAKFEIVEKEKAEFRPSNSDEMVKKRLKDIKTRKAAPQYREPRYRVRYESGTCFFMNPTDFEVQKPTETVTMNSATTSLLKTRKQLYE